MTRIIAATLNGAVMVGAFVIGATIVAVLLVAMFAAQAAALALNSLGRAQGHVSTGVSHLNRRDLVGQSIVDGECRVL